MFITFMVMYLVEYRHVIIFHEQHHLFRFSMDYYQWTMHENGFWWPLMEFVIQFGYYPWLGAMVWSLLLVGMYLMSQSIIKRLTGWYDMLQLSAILPCFMFFDTVCVDVQPVATVKAFFIVLGIWIVALIAGRFIPKLSDRFSSKNKKTDKKPQVFIELVWPILGVVIFGLLFLYAHKDYYKPRTIDNNGKKIELTREAVKKWRKNEKLMIMADQAVRRGDWDEVLKLSNQVLRTGGNHLMAYFRSMALYHRGELATRLFDLPQTYSDQTLFFPWMADRNKAEYGGVVYEQMGAVNTAAHWESEALVGWGETASHLINLSRYYIETGKPAQARKLIAPLKETLFYRSTARELEQYLADGDVPDLEDALKDVPEGGVARFDNVMNISADALHILRYRPDNVMAREYFLMSMLLANQVGIFYRYLKELYPAGSELPRYYWEALCLIRMQKGSDYVTESGWTIPADVDNDFRAYVAEMNKGQYARYTPAQKQTYWYYVTNVSRYRPTLSLDEEIIEETPQIHSQPR